MKNIYNGSVVYLEQQHKKLFPIDCLFCKGNKPTKPTGKEWEKIERYFLEKV